MTFGSKNLCRALSNRHRVGGYKDFQRVETRHIWSRSKIQFSFVKISKGIPVRVSLVMASPPLNNQPPGVMAEMITPSDNDTFPKENQKEGETVSGNKIIMHLIFDICIEPVYTYIPI